jgi:hypothetical protein
VRSGTLLTPRPAPGKLFPAAASGAVVLLALPIFVIAAWDLKGWALGAVLWAGAQAIGLLVSRLQIGSANLASSGVLAFGMMFRTIAVMVVLVAVAVTDTSLAVAGLLVYAFAYTCELALSLLSYYGSEPQ